VRATWAPKIAGIRTSQLGGRGPYADVEEDLSCNIRDTTASLCWSRLDTLARLLDKAERWWLRDENISPIVLKYAPQGSTIHSNATPMQAVVLGRVGNEELNGVVLPTDANDAGMLFEIDGVRITCLRRGAWIGATEAANVAAAGNPSIRTVTMPSAPATPGPLQLDITGFVTGAGGNIDIPPGFVMLATNMDLQEAEAPFATTLAAGATYVSTADAAARASAGNVGRLNHSASALGAESILTFVMPGSVATSTQLAVYCTVRNTSGSEWTMRASGASGQIVLAPLTRIFTPSTAIGTSVNINPTAIYLGTIVNRFGTAFVQLHIALTALVGAGTFDLDTVVFVDLSTGNAAVLSVNGARMAGTADINATTTVTIEHNPRTLQAPDVRIRLSGGSRIAQTYSGPADIVGAGSSLKTLWYATHLWNGTTPYWTTQNVTGAAILQVGAAINRQLAYLSPQ
jgi:hypothetical protein